MEKQNLFKSKKEFGEFLKNASIKALKNAGFCLWESNTKKHLYLIPSQFYKLIPDGFTLYSISYHKEVFSKKTDNDSRFGVLAYGVLRKPTTQKRTLQTKK